jgi:hypothetical protein
MVANALLPAGRFARTGGRRSAHRQGRRSTRRPARPGWRASNRQCIQEHDMTRVLRSLLLLTVSALLCPVGLAAQDNAPSEPKPKESERSTGLPSQIKWTFNLDAGWGTFGFGNSLYTNPKEPGVDEDLSDQWFEGYIKPALSANFVLPSTGELYGKVSAVGERTYGSVPASFGQDISSFGPEDLHIGWRSGQALTLGDNALDFTVGRAQYRLGHGFLLFDGSSEGGSRGGYWTNARKAFQFAFIGRFKPAAHALEAFYLDRDELEENDSGSRLWGVNYEYSLLPDTTLGVTYMKWAAHPDMKPGRDGLDVFNVRAYSALTAARNLSIEFEYASERNEEALNSNAWTLQGAYLLSQVTWKPKISYRYAFFQGDDPATPANEAFDPLFLGFHDWGGWWQGEIAGEYFLSNSNLKSHMVRVHATPSESIGAGLIFFDFSLDQPQSAGAGVTDSDVAFEVDAYTDWKLNQNFTVSLVLAYADPGKAVQQASGRTKNFAYAMVYFGYGF